MSTIYNNLAIGLSKLDITNVQVEVKSFGIRSNRSFSRKYFHLLIPVNNEFDDVFVENYDYQTDETYYKRYQLNNLKKMIGFRIGYDINNFHKFGLQAGFEAGVFPGLSSNMVNNIYFKFKAALGFGVLFSE